jgi:hypothetical protein
MQSGMRTASLFYNYMNVKTNGWDVCNFIIEGFWIGMVPTKEAPIEEATNLDLKIVNRISAHDAKRPLKLVVSVVEPQELAKHGFMGVKTVAPHDWQQLGAEHHLVIMRDFSANVALFDAIKAVLKIKYCIDNGGAVYAHCKAGRSRSAMIGAIYLVVFAVIPTTGHLFTLEKAVQFLKEKRKQIDLGQSKLEKAAEIISKLREYKLDALMRNECTIDDVIPLLPKEHQDDMRGFLNELISQPKHTDTRSISL